MANDVGVRIGVDGERQFRAAIGAINAQARSLNAELRETVSSFAGMKSSEESVAAQTDVLNRAISTQQQRLQLLTRQQSTAQQRLEELGQELDRATRQFGANSRQAAQAQNAYNNQARTVAELNRQISNGRADINRYRQQMDSLTNSVDDAADAMEDAEQESVNLGSSLRDAFIGGAIAGGIQAMIGAISDLAESTVEYNRIIGSLEVSSQKAGYTAGETKETYKQLFAVLGDEQTTATTVANLQALGLEQDQLTELTNGAIGAWATYGDSIPIDGLAEAINETVKAGAVTGTFADVLNWAGTSEDDFNAKLEATGSQSERVRLVLDELSNQNLPQAAQAWRDNNEELINYQLSNAQLMDTMGQLGTMVMPVATAVKTATSDILTTLMDTYVQLREQGFGLITSVVDGIIANAPAMIDSARKAIADFFQGLQERHSEVIDNGKEIIIKLINGLIDNLPELLTTAVEMLTGFARTILSNLPQIVSAGLEIVKAIIGGIWREIPNLLQAGIDIIIDLSLTLLRDIPSMFAQVGLAIAQGIWQGIKDSASWIKDNIKDWAGSIVGTVKDALGIASPSKVMRAQVGRPFAEGFALGIKDKTAEAQKSAAELKTKAVAPLKSIKQETAAIATEAVAEIPTAIMAAEPIVIATAQELNDRLLAKVDELTLALKAKGLEEATKEALQGQLEAVKTFQSEYQRAMEEISKTQESMTERLRQYGELFTRVTDEESGKELIYVADLQVQIDTLNELNQVLTNLENAGVPSELLDSIAQMDIDDAVGYGLELLKMGTAELDNYLTLWAQKQAKAKEISERYYQTEFEALKTQYLDRIPAEVSNLKAQIAGTGKEVGRAITESIGMGASGAAAQIGSVQQQDTTEADVFTRTVEGLREQQYILIEYLISLTRLAISTIRDFLGDFRDTGRQLMDGVAAGVLDGQSGVVEAVRQSLEAAAQAARDAMQIASPSKVFTEIGDYMAQGIGKGFMSRMDDVSADIAGAMPSSIDVNRANNINSGGGGTTTDNRTYRSGDIILNIDRVDNSSERNIQNLAQELQFYINQNNAAVGGV